MDYLSEEQITEFKATFQLFDFNNDGYLNTNELGKIIRSLGNNPTETELYEMINDVDEYQTGKIDFPKFIQLMAHQNVNRKHEESIKLRQAFRVFDHEGNGFISVDKLRQVMTNFGERLSTNEIEEIINEVDVDGDGLINYEEFVRNVNMSDENLL